MQGGQCKDGDSGETGVIMDEQQLSRRMRIIEDAMVYAAATLQGVESVSSNWRGPVAAAQSKLREALAEVMAFHVDEECARLSDIAKSASNERH